MHLSLGNVLFLVLHSRLCCVRQFQLIGQGFQYLISIEMEEGAFNSISGQQKKNWSHIFFGQVKSDYLLNQNFRGKLKNSRKKTCDPPKTRGLLFTQIQGHLDFYMYISTYCVNKSVGLGRVQGERKGAGKEGNLKNLYHVTIVVFIQEPEVPGPVERKEPTTPTDPNCGFTPNLARYNYVHFQQRTLCSEI